MASPIASPPIVWPDGKAFAFTVFDDTDWGTVANLAPVYDCLAANGMRTTKSVWVLPGTEPPAEIGGATCDESGWFPYDELCGGSAARRCAMS